jgi:hypothetical protein
MAVVSGAQSKQTASQIQRILRPESASMID